MSSALQDMQFVIFDTETTGLDPRQGDRIVEIAAVRVRDGRVEASFESLMNPGRPVSEGAFRVNHISQEMLDAAPGPEKVIPEFMRFVQGSCLCSYNAPFDMGFLLAELALRNESFDPAVPVVDVLKMARKLLPGLGRYALWAVAEHLGMQLSQRHRAAADVEMTLEVFRSLMASAQGKGIGEFGKFASLFGWQCAGMGEEMAGKLTRIQRAIDQQATLHIQYFSSSHAQLTERDVQPQEIRKEGGTAYMVAHCLLKNDRRSFRVDNIVHVEMA